MKLNQQLIIETTVVVSIFNLRITSMLVFVFVSGFDPFDRLNSDSNMDPLSVTMTQTSAFMQESNLPPTPPPPPAISVVTFRWDDKIKDNKGGPDR